MYFEAGCLPKPGVLQLDKTGCLAKPSMLSAFYVDADDQPRSSCLGGKHFTSQAFPQALRFSPVSSLETEVGSHAMGPMQRVDSSFSCRRRWHISISLTHLLVLLSSSLKLELLFLWLPYHTMGIQHWQNHFSIQGCLYLRRRRQWLLCSMG